MGRPHISYHNVYTLDYAFFDGSQWVIETVDDSPSVGGYSSIEVDSSSIPHISYFDSNWNDLNYARGLSSDLEDGNTPTTPTGFALHPAAPNPSDGSTSICFSIPRTCEVELALYDIKGRKVATLAEGTHQPGEYAATASGLSSGVYIFELTADEFRDCKKMVVK